MSSPSADCKKKHLSLTQVRRMRSQNDLLKKQTKENLKTDSSNCSETFRDNPFTPLFSSQTPKSVKIAQKLMKTSPVASKKRSKSLSGVAQTDSQILDVSETCPQSPNLKPLAQNHLNNTNNTIPSVLLESHLDILNELSKSIQELNKRLVRSEEISQKRFIENLNLQSKVQSLELRVSSQESTVPVCSPCSSNCLLF